ncbi:MAG: hypothetical protein AB7Q00_09380 [Phycisphaerales bacterium]|nr:MAG: hypothetical protein IPK69_02225 [Phycisphaerales bacterium]
MNLDPTGANYSATPAASLAGADAVKRIQSNARVQPTRESRERPGEQDHQDDAPNSAAQTNTTPTKVAPKPTRSSSRPDPDQTRDIFEQQRELRDAAVDRLKDVIDPDLVDGEWPKQDKDTSASRDSRANHQPAPTPGRENPPSALDLFA